ncbi:Gonadotropin-releasing hormone II receptor [Halotydeus destructor]|nr:Gonadotropin-releasing hormone II receptor [Halotydeus destructor]
MTRDVNDTFVDDLSLFKALTRLELNFSDSSGSIIEQLKSIERKKVVPEIVAYAIVLFIGAIGNLRALFILLRRRHLQKLFNVFMVHLTLADLLVVFLTIPIEIAWRITISWEMGGHLGCKLLQTLRAFGLYLSSMMIVSISLDRMKSVRGPLENCAENKSRSRRYIIASYTASAILSFPQAIIYRVEKHPFLLFDQCVDFESFKYPWMATIYNITCLTGMYFGPLVTIIFCYSVILKKTQYNDIMVQLSGLTTPGAGTVYSFTAGTASTECCCARKSCSNSVSKSYQISAIRFRDHRDLIVKRARARTLKMTIIIVVAFIVCWTPYAMMVIWYQFDAESFQSIDPMVQQLLFIFAIANACVNPFVYNMNLVKHFA